MPIPLPYLTEHSEPFIVVAADAALRVVLDTIADAKLQLEVQATALYVIMRAADGWGIAPAATLEEITIVDVLEYDQPIQNWGALFQSPAEVFTTDGAQTPEELEDMLGDLPGQALLILDPAGNVVGLLRGKIASGGAWGKTIFLNFVQKWLNDKRTDDVAFTAHYPNAVKTSVLSRVLVYLHTAATAPAVEYDARLIKTDQRVNLGAQNTATNTFTLKRNTALDVWLQCASAAESSVTFDPQHTTMVWTGDWVRAELAFMVSSAYAAPELPIDVVFYLAGGIEIARIPLSVTVDHSNTLAQSTLLPQSVGAHKKVFISYSRKDKEVVAMYREALRMTGDDIFLDTDSIPAGADWERTLHDAIQKAQTFQLFWSRAAAESPNVRNEWMFLLQNCGANCDQILRPVYWQKPVPPIPQELQRYNFISLKLPTVP